MRKFLSAQLLLVLASVLGADTFGADGGRRVNPFYAMDTNVWSWQDRTPEQVAALLKDLGYDGYGHGGTKDIDAYLAALEAQGLEMFTTYVGLNLDAEPMIDPAVSTVFGLFKGRNAMLWLFVQSSRFARIQRPATRPPSMRFADWPMRPTNTASRSLTRIPVSLCGKP